jgi:hypothetical protein
MMGFYYKNAILNFYVNYFITKKLLSWLKFVLLKHKDIILLVTTKIQGLNTASHEDSQHQTERAK